MDRRGVSRWWLAKVLFSLALILYGAASAILRPGAVAFSGIIAAALLMILGALIHLWHYGLLKRTAGELGRPARLVTTRGFFPYIRHPMYLGDAIMSAGAWLLSADAPATIILILFLLTLPPLVHDEDRMMARAFPDEYPDWAARTRRLLPRIY